MNFIGNSIKQEKTPNLSSYVVSGERPLKYISCLQQLPPDSSFLNHRRLFRIWRFRRSWRSSWVWDWGHTGCTEAGKNSDFVSLRGWTSDTVRQTWVLWKSRARHTLHTHTHNMPVRTHTYECTETRKVCTCHCVKKVALVFFTARDSQPVLTNALSP